MRFCSKIAAVAASALFLTVAAIPVNAAVDQTIFSWENTHENFRVGQSGDGPFVGVQNTTATAITHGSYSAQAPTTGTTTWYRGEYSTDLAAILKGNTVVKLDFAVASATQSFHDVTVAIFLAWHDENGVQASASSTNTARLQSGTAVFDYSTLAAPIVDGTAVDARAEFRFIRNGGYTGDVYFDNFRVEVIPEPASLSLAGLAGAGLLLRRRRSA